MPGELSPFDEQAAGLARNAAGWLTAAGQKALARGDMPAAANLLERAASLLPSGDQERHQLLPKLGMALAETGNKARADELFVEWIDAEQRGRSLLVYRDGDGHQRVFDLDAAASHVTIGRRTSNDLALGWDTEVSREHAVLDRENGDWMLTDEGSSRNGSYVNGDRIAGRRQLEDGDVLRFGHSAVLFRAGVQRRPARARTRDTTAAEGSVLPRATPGPPA